MWTQEDEIKLNDIKLRLVALEKIKADSNYNEEVLTDITEAIRSDQLDRIEIEYIPMIMHLNKPSTNQKRVTLIFKVR